jgi:hypothetical protein
VLQECMLNANTQWINVSFASHLTRDRQVGHLLAFSRKNWGYPFHATGSTNNEMQRILTALFFHNTTPSPWEFYLWTEIRSKVTVEAMEEGMDQRLTVRLAKALNAGWARKSCLWSEEQSRFWPYQCPPGRPAHIPPLKTML